MANFNVQKICDFTYPPNATKKESEMFPHPRGIIMFEVDPEYRVVADFLSWRKQIQPACLTAPGQPCDHTIKTDLVPRICVHIAKKIDLLRSLQAGGQKAICVSPPSTTSIRTDSQDGCPVYQEKGTLIAGKQYTPVQVDYYADAGSAASAYAYVCKQAQNVSEPSHWAKATREEALFTGNAKLAFSATVNSTVLAIGKLLYAANEAAKNIEGKPEEFIPDAFDVATAVHMQFWDLYFQDQNYSALQGNIRQRRDELIKALRQNMVIPSVAYKDICAKVSDVQYFQTRADAIVAAAESVIAAPRKLPSSFIATWPVGCELWSGVANSGNDPFGQFNFHLCPTATGVTGQAHWFGLNSGTNVREFTGQWNGTSLTLQDLRMVEQHPKPGWIFCTIDQYVLSRNGESLDGYYISKSCRDRAEVHLKRRSMK